MEETNKNEEQLLSDISKLEAELSESLGTAIWNYANILNPNVLPNEVKFTNLSDSQIKLLTDYIAKVSELIVSFSLDPVEIASENSRSELDNLTSAFIEASSMLYSVRYLLAKGMFAEYSLVRIHTWMESKLLAQNDRDKSPETAITYKIDMPGSIKTNDDGDVDIINTQQTEDVEQTIKSYLSIFPEAKSACNKLYDSLLENLSYGMIPRLYPDEMTKLSQDLITIILSEPVHNIYNYLTRGYTINQAINNVKEYYSKLIEQQSFSLQPQMSDYEKMLDDKILSTLNKITGIEEKTVQDLVDEIKEQLLISFAAGMFYPAAYYQLNFRKASTGNIAEVEYEYVMDSYIYDNNNLVTEFPIETYALILTDAAKEEIFNYVTNQQINPSYQLRDYINYQPYELK